MIERPLRVGIIGAGFGRSVHLPAFDSIAGAEVVALGDNGSGRAEAANRGRPRALNIFNDGLELAAWHGIDVLSVAVPPAHQREIVRTALEHGKAVLCEKPLTLNLVQALELVRLGKSFGTVTACGYEFRYDAGISALVKNVKEGRVGRVRHIAVAWFTSGGANPDRPWSWRDDQGSGGGVLNEYCSHVFDYASLIVGASIAKICCQCRTVVKERPCAGEMRSVTAPDQCEIFCEFQNGVTGQFSISNVCHAALGHRIEVYGENGCLTFHHLPPFNRESLRLIFRDRAGRNEDIPCIDVISSAVDTRLDAFRHLAFDFIDAVEGIYPPSLPTFEDAFKVHYVIDAAWRSAKSCSIVSVDSTRQIIHS